MIAWGDNRKGGGAHIDHCSEPGVVSSSLQKNSWDKRYNTLIRLSPKTVD
jgi:hypothetical protein